MHPSTQMQYFFSPISPSGDDQIYSVFKIDLNYNFVGLLHHSVFASALCITFQLVFTNKLVSIQPINDNQSSTIKSNRNVNPHKRQTRNKRSQCVGYKIQP